MANIQFLNGSKAGEHFPLVEDQTVIGRYPFCDIVLDDHTVSREHVRIVRGDDGFYVEDLNSLNGTFLNGEKIRSRSRLHDKDRIQIYEISATFFEAEPDADQASAEPAAEAASEVVATGVAEPHIVNSVSATSDSRVGVNTEQKLQAILDITRSLGSSLAADEVLQQVLNGLFQIFPQAKQAYIQLPEREGSDLITCAIKNRGEESEGLTLAPLNRALAGRVFENGNAVLSTDDESHFARSNSVLESDVRSMMCAPLMGPGQKILGIIHIDTDDPARPFSQHDLDVLASVATIAGQVVQFARIHETSLRLDRRDRELATAREVQRHFLPSRRPDVAGYEFYDYYVPADEIGGDYFGYIPLPDGKLAIAMGDVAGKGVSAALLMARLCSEVPYRLVMASSPIETVARLNDELFGPDFECPFVTFGLCLLDPHEHTLSFVNAGHLPPLWRHASSRQVDELGTLQDGLPLGVDKNATYSCEKVILEPGDQVVLYTDGISDTVNPRGTMYGIQRVRDVVATGPLRPGELGRTIVEGVKRFQEEAPQTDDICLLCFARLPE